MKVYCAGPMSWIAQFNIPAFDAVATDLRGRGIEVVSPSELDAPEVREAALASLDGDPSSVSGTWEDFLARDIQVVCRPDVEAIVVLPGWRESRGATFETDVARRLGKPILDYPDLLPVAETLKDAWNKERLETRITDPKTGGQKGQKLGQLGAVDPTALMSVARVAGFGATKYERLNFMKGYAWSLSFDAMQRHLLAFWAGQDTDEESGLPHLAHAGWHALALLAFQKHGLGTDDRWQPCE